MVNGLPIFSKVNCSIQQRSFRTQPCFYRGSTREHPWSIVVHYSHFNDVNKPLQSSRIITYADDTVIFTCSSNLDNIERNLNNDINNLSILLAME